MYLNIFFKNPQEFINKSTSGKDIQIWSEVEQEKKNTPGMN
jgi:hypothetical protein